MDTKHYSPEFEFTPEQLKLLQSQGEEPLRVPVKEANKVYLVVEECAIPTLDDEYIRQGLAHAVAQVARGEIAEWDPEEIKAAGRALRAQRHKQS